MTLLSSTPSQAPNSHSSPASKKRRFVPNSIPITTPTEKSWSEEQAFNAPFILQVYGQAPQQSDVQTQLFQVGMRVRKSVTEGYRTTIKHTSPILESNITMHSNSNVPTIAGWFSTQRTLTRTWTYSSDNKRSYRREQDEDSDEVDLSPMTPKVPGSDHKVVIPPDYFDINRDFDNMDQDISPRTYVEDSPSRKGVLKQRVNGRKIAVPKSRRSNWTPDANLKRIDQMPCWNIMDEMMDESQSRENNVRFQSRGTQWLGHERSSSEALSSNPTSRIQSNDFEEASFLRRREDIEMDCS